MLTRCHHWELGKAIPPATCLAERLQELPAGEALLALSRMPFPADWAQNYFCVLLDGPSRFMRAYYSTPPAATCLEDQRNEQLDWLLEFKKMRQASLTKDLCQSTPDRLRQRILTMLDWEERAVHPPLNKFLQTDRPTREMRYEHDGIRRFLPGLESALGADGNWERFSLDLVHLLEHHLKHEGDGLFPVYERLVEAGLGQSEVQ